MLDMRFMESASENNRNLAIMNAISSRLVPLGRRRQTHATIEPCKPCIKATIHAINVNATHVNAADRKKPYHDLINLGQLPLKITTFFAHRATIHTCAEVDVLFAD